MRKADFVVQNKNGVFILLPGSAAARERVDTLCSEDLISPYGRTGAMVAHTRINPVLDRLRAEGWYVV